MGRYYNISVFEQQMANKRQLVVTSGCVCDLRPPEVFSGLKFVEIMQLSTVDACLYYRSSFEIQVSTCFNSMHWDAPTCQQEAVHTSEWIHSSQGL